MRTSDENKRYPQGATISILLCALSFLYLYLGLWVVPVLTIIGQVYFIYASKLWVKRYGGKRNFDLAHSLFHLGHPRWVTDWGGYAVPCRILSVTSHYVGSKLLVRC